MTRWLLVCSLLLGGCDLCWPRGGGLGTCAEPDDDDSGDDDDTADDDDSSADDDDSGDDDDSTADGPPCAHGEILTGPSFSWNDGEPQAATWDFVCIHGGTFRMGRETSDPDWEEDEDAHDVTLTYVYAMALWELPQALWIDRTGSNPSECFEPAGCGPLHPTNRISWADSIEFANALSDEEGLDRAHELFEPVWTIDLDADGYRLPTEAEWEFAARAGTDLAYSGSDEPDDVAWCDLFFDDYARRAGLLLPNALGIYDMSGNVTEHVWDRYDDYPSEPQVDPTGPLQGSFTVRRGGSFDSPCSLSQVRHRGFNTPSGTYDLGVRLVRTLWRPPPE